MAAKSKQDILSLIEADHRKVEELFDQFEELEGKKAQECFKQIYKELTLHARVEELVFYPALREYEEMEGYIEEAESEHNSVKILLEQMKSLKPSDSEFETKMTHLQESVMHHVEEEEDEIFEAVRSAMDEAELEELGQEFQTTKTKIESEVEALAGIKGK